MYIRSSHRPRSQADVLTVMREHMFATMVSASPEEGMIASHLPFVYEPDRGAHGTLYAHMARANPHGALLGRGELVIFTGPHGYISPSWYADRATAPTWDYAAVHCHGVAVVHDLDEAERNIERLLRVVEGDAGWSLHELPRADVERMLANIVSFEIPLTRIEGKFKLNQGETRERTQQAIARLEMDGSAALAAWIRQYNEP